MLQGAVGTNLTLTLALALALGAVAAIIGLKHLLKPPAPTLAPTSWPSSRCLWYPRSMNCSRVNIRHHIIPTDIPPD